MYLLIFKYQILSNINQLEDGGVWGRCVTGERVANSYFYLKQAHFLFCFENCTSFHPELEKNLSKLLEGKGKKKQLVVLYIESTQLRIEENYICNQPRPEH